MDVRAKKPLTKEVKKHLVEVRHRCDLRSDLCHLGQHIIPNIFGRPHPLPREYPHEFYNFSTFYFRRSPLFHPIVLQTRQVDGNRVFA